MKSFVAIDFETANQHRSSVCSVGVVIVEESIIIDSYYELIRPNPNFYASWATNIHGINYWDTIRAKTFPEVWGQISNRINGLPLVAHNSSFDKSCLKAVFELYGMSYPNYEFYCTYRASKKIFKNLPNHQLKTVSDHIGFNLINHHHALADAQACAYIAIKIF